MMLIIFFTCSAGRSLPPICSLVDGDLPFPRASHSSMAFRSYTRPSSAVTGSTGSSWVIGQTNSAADSSSTLLKRLCSVSVSTASRVCSASLAMLNRSTIPSVHGLFEAGGIEECSTQMNLERGHFRNESSQVRSETTPMKRKKGFEILLSHSQRLRKGRSLEGRMMAVGTIGVSCDRTNSNADNTSRSPIPSPRAHRDAGASSIAPRLQAS